MPVIDVLLPWECCTDTLPQRRHHLIYRTWSSHHGSAVTNPTSIPEDVGLIPGLTQWVKDPALQ